MCPSDIRNLSAVVHNLAWRLTPGSASLCKVISKFHDMKSALERAAIYITEESPIELRVLLSAAKAASYSETVQDLFMHKAALTMASEGIQPLSDAHFADRKHSHGD